MKQRKALEVARTALESERSSPGTMGIGLIQKETEMVIIDLAELQKAKALIDLANSVPLNEVKWQLYGTTIEAPQDEAEAWQFVGLSNAYFAYEYLLTPNAQINRAAGEVC